MGIVDRFRTSRLLRTLRASQTAPPEALAEAKNALTEMGSSAVESLLECLIHPGAREPALEILERILTTDTLPSFVEALGSADRRVSSGVIDVMSKGRRYNAKDLLPYLSEREVSKSRLEPVLLAREADLPPADLLAMLPDLEREARTIAYRLLEARVDESIRFEALRYLSHKDWWVRAHMAKLLARIPGEETEKGLVPTLSDPNKSVRMAAVKALSILKAKSAVPALTNVLRDGDLTVQAAAIDALIEINDPAAVPHLVDVLKDESEQCRRGAVEVLNEVATTEAIQDLVAALRDADWWVRVRAADALGTIGGEKVVQAILGLMDDDDVHIRRYAVEILNTIPDGRSVDSLLRALGDDDWWVRERSIDALGRTGDPRAIDPLVKMMSIDPEAAPLCAKALGVIGDPCVIAPLADLLGREPSEELHRELLAALKEVAKKRVATGEDQHLLEEALRSEGFRVEKTRLRPMTVRQAGVRSRPVTQTEPLVRQERPPAPTPQSTPTTTPVPAEVRADDIQDGQMLLERYKVLSRIGSGGFSTVFLVEDTKISDSVIIKILSHHLSLDENSMARFVQELKLARKISHPNVIRIHDLLELGRERGISMEYFPGQDLGQLLDEARTLPPVRAVPILVQVCDGLAAAHTEKIIHRDIKPANILVGGDDRVKIVDFGLAAATREAENRLTRTGHLVGTPHYMAPEVIRGEEIDERSDLYSLGIMMYEIFAGNLPYDGDNPMNVLFRHLDGDAPPLADLCEVPADLGALVMSTMAVDRTDRPDTAAALAAALRALAL